MGRLEGKRVFLTGGARRASAGAAALLFAAEGARVAIADIDEEGRQGNRGALADGRKRRGPRFFIIDVTRQREVERAIGGSRRALRRASTCSTTSTPAAATPADGPVTEASVEEFWRAIGLDLFGTFLVCKYGLPHLIAAGAGSVVNTASSVALNGLPGRDCYTAAKGRGSRRSRGRWRWNTARRAFA